MSLDDEDPGVGSNFGRSIGNPDGASSQDIRLRRRKNMFTWSQRQQQVKRIQGKTRKFLKATRVGDGHTLVTVTSQ